MADRRTLSDEELVRLSKGGDAESTDLLMIRFKPLVRYIAGAYFIADGEESDLVQEGMIGLFKAVRDYSEERDALFRTFATLCIRRQIIDAVRSAERKKHGTLNSSLPLEALTSADMLDYSTPEETLAEKEAHKELKENISNILSDYEIRILNLYLERKSYKEISDLTGKDLKSVDNALQRIRKKIRNLIE